MTLEEVNRLLGPPKVKASADDILKMSGLGGQGAGLQRMGVPLDQMFAIYEHATGTYKLVFRGGKVAEVNQHP